MHAHSKFSFTIRSSLSNFDFFFAIREILLDFTVLFSLDFESRVEDLTSDSKLSLEDILVGYIENAWRIKIILLFESVC